MAKGRDIGEECPSCKQGFLEPVTSTESGSNRILGPGGRSWSHTRIERLACSECSATYEARLRGTDIATLYEGDLKAHRDLPSEAPEACPTCKHPKFLKINVDDPDGLTARERPGFQSRPVRHASMACSRCHRLVSSEYTTNRMRPDSKSEED